MKEKWKNIPDYEGLYQISNLGRIKNYKNQILKSSKRYDGYVKVNLSKNGEKKTYYLHRLVVSAFWGESSPTLHINHKDENKSNNSLDNLELCNQKYNNNYGTRGRRISKSLAKKVDQYDLNGNFIKTWNSHNEAEKVLHIFNISSVLSNRRRSAGGYIWRESI